jgi:hypothetical protein
MTKLNNQSGQVTPEFLFSIVVAFGLFMLFLAISFTLSIVEVGQYIAYSTSRAQVGGNLDPDAQRTAALNKYKELGADPAFKFMFQSGWFVFGTPDVRQGNGVGTNNTSSTDFRKELGDGGSQTYQFLKVFTGVSVPFQSKILNLQIPFLRPGRSDDQGFSTNINAILIREPTQSECYNYWDQRATALKTLPSGSGAFYDPTSYARMEDSGC